MANPNDREKHWIGPTATIVLLICLCAFVFMLVSFVRRTQQNSAIWMTLPADGPKLSDRWVELIRGDKFDEALPDCSTAFKKRLDAKLRDALTAAVKRLPPMPVKAGWSTVGGLNRFVLGFGRGPFFDVVSQSPVLSYRLILSNDPANPEELVITSIVENGRIVIDDVEVGSPKRSPPTASALPPVLVPTKPSEPKGPPPDTAPSSSPTTSPK